ncbi:MAG: SH3 domain-containing protein [Aliihoeflea sp.]|uniref:SH3 domain-containing protein n=1 Tax=Aliihoeflea sp. TaxID=2608088 RepID=UPI004033B037
MSSDNPRRRIDWNGEGQQENATQLLKSRGFLRKASVPAAIGLTGLALVAALAAGPIMRGMTESQPGPTVAIADAVETDAVETTAVVQPASAANLPAEAVETEAVSSASAATPSETPVTTTAARAPAEAEAPGLDANDPRWNPTALAIDEDKLTALKQAVDETVAAAEIATAMGNTGGIVTSGIPTTAAGFAPERPTAAASERSAFDAALITEDEQVEAQPAVASSDLSPAKATQYVNMRAAPEDGAAVVVVVPANASIEAETDCRWCEVSYNGQKGYIFQSFITR